MGEIGLFSRPDDNILTGSVVTATVAPLTSYSLATLLLNQPSARVLWGVKTVTITFTLGSSQRGDVIAIPIWNADAGSSVATLTNGAGLSQALTVPTMTPHRIPDTTVLDLRVGTPSNPTRTSGVWNLVISGNSANLVIGGCVWIGQLRTFERNFSWGVQDQPEWKQSVLVNDYGEDYAVDYQTLIEAYTVSFDQASDADRLALKAWWQASHGGALPSLFWPDPAVVQAYVGRWPPGFAATLNALNLSQLPLTFTARSKGKPV